MIRFRVRESLSLALGFLLGLRLGLGLVFKLGSDFG